MARFIGYISGGKGTASRIGNASSGLSAEARGWNIGGKVVMGVDAEGRDCVSFYVTGGSNARVSSRLIASGVLDKGEIKVKV